MLDRKILPYVGGGCCLRSAAGKDFPRTVRWFVRFHDGEINGGLLQDLGEVLAHRMGYTARFVTVPRKRVAIALTQGEADGAFSLMPSWIDGTFNWARPTIPGASVIVAHSTAPVLKSLQSLFSERVGTALGLPFSGPGRAASQQAAARRCAFGAAFDCEAGGRAQPVWDR